MPVFKMLAFKQVVRVCAQTVTVSLVHVIPVIVSRAVAQPPTLLNLLHVRWDAAKKRLKHAQSQIANAKVAIAPTATATRVLVMFVNV